MPPQQGTQTVPPPPTGDPNVDIQAPGDGGKMDRFRSIITKLSGGGTPAIEKALEQHHAEVMANAQRLSTDAKRYYGMIAKAKIDGKSPMTGKPVTPEELDTWQKQADGALADYTKIASKAKAAKPIIQQMGGLLKHITGHHGGADAKGGSAGPAAGGSPQGGGQAAPQGASPAASPSSQGSPTVPPPPSGAQSAAEGEAQDAAMKEQTEFRVKRGEKAADIAGEIEGRREGLKADGFTDEQIRTIEQSKTGGVGMRTRMHPVKVQDPNGPEGQTIPALQDAMTGEVFDPQGQVVENPHLFPTAMMETVHTGETPVFNPQTNQFEQQPTRSTSRKVAPGGSAASSSGKAPSGGKAGSNGAAPSGGTAPGSGGRHGIPARQFNILQKQATAIDEARNSLVGPDPSKSVGGLAADLHVFDNKDSVKRISEYLGLVNSQIANEAKSVAGQGAWAAAEWYVGLPQTVIELQQGALADASRGLQPEEQRFVADYYRVLSTIGGMRAATGASSAQWSYNTLRGELPTPGPVTSRIEAGRRINNFIQETNVVAKRNPLLNKAADVPTMGGKRPGTVPPPPSGTKSIDDEIMEAVHGKPSQR